MEYTVKPEPPLRAHRVSHQDMVHLPELLHSEKSSSQPLSLVPSPEVITAPNSLSKPTQLPAYLQPSRYPPSQYTTTKDFSYDHSYSRVSISSLVNPTPQSEYYGVSGTKDRKRCLSPTLEKTLRYKIPKNYSAKYDFSPRSTGKASMISCLVDLSVMTIESVRNPNLQMDSKTSRESLHVFITQLFRRSQVSKTVVQLALVFCLRTQNTLKTVGRFADTLCSTNAQSEFLHVALCGRRLFLGSLICATKYLQDTNFSNSTWAKIVGIPSSDISLIERIFLQLVNYRLFVRDFDFYPYACRILELSSTRAPVPTELGHVVKELFYKA